METGQPILDTYLDEVEWLEVLKERGIDINTQIQEEL
jgi:hypothetical protein